ncbi:hypothetical protein NDU88_007716 [Pleurodeles waltl]|uniref:Uncharacterized protein n=1 Tax=Pleurodeles waltl TaxID=8319 RepID=A0AAV7U3Y1_PLEWA|nr:hypothetical protein NDU88_007716 [Pleurodeles waltl]
MAAGRAGRRGRLLRATSHCKAVLRFESGGDSASLSKCWCQKITHRGIDIEYQKVRHKCDTRKEEPEAWNVKDLRKQPLAGEGACRLACLTACDTLTAAMSDLASVSGPWRAGRITGPGCTKSTRLSSRRKPCPSRKRAWGSWGSAGPWGIPGGVWDLGGPLLSHSLNVNVAITGSPIGGDYKSLSDLRKRLRPRRRSERHQSAVLLQTKLINQTEKCTSDCADK